MPNLNLACEQTDTYRNNKRMILLGQMREKFPQYKGLLDFFEPIFKARKRYAEALAAFPDIQIIDDPVYQMRHHEGFPILTKNDIPLDAPIITDYFLKLAKIIKDQAPDKSKMLDDIIQRNGKFRFETLIGHDFNKAPTIADNVMIDFLIDETLGPVLEIYSEKLKHHIKHDAWSETFCPVCGKKPVFALIKADDGKRILVCSTCSFEWEFKRIQCTHCGNEDQKLLSYLVVEHEDMYRIETCDACRRYLKTIDLKNATHEIVYDIESIITLHLDIIAGNHGYSNSFCQPPPETVTQSN
jgi:FdhE protein